MGWMVIQENHQKHADYVKDYDLQSAEACWRYKPEWVAERIAPRQMVAAGFLRLDIAPSCSSIRKTIYPGRRANKAVPVRLEQITTACYRGLRPRSGPRRSSSSPAQQHYESYYFCSPEHHEIGMVEAERRVPFLPIPLARLVPRA